MNFNSNGADTSGMVLEEVASDCIEVEVTVTDEMCILEPLKDHNYLTSIIQTEVTKPRSTKRIIKKKPKITSLTLLYNCKICGYTTTKQDIFTKHQEVHGKITQGTNYVPCNKCNVNKNTPKGYHKCPHCTFYAKNMASLRVHMHIHNSGRAYKCTECMYHGKDLKDLVNHLKTSKTYLCEYCRFTSHVHETFLSHQKKHGEKTRMFNNEQRIDR